MTFNKSSPKIQSKKDFRKSWKITLKYRQKRISMKESSFHYRYIFRTVGFILTYLFAYLFASV